MKRMNAGLVNWMFLAIFVFYMAVTFGLNYYVLHGGRIGIYPLYLISELIFVVPALLFAARGKGSLRALLPIRKIRISTALMTVLFTFLCMPLTSVLNGFTMFFVENAVAESSGQIVAMPFAAMFFFIAVYAPVCEETVFRGITYESLKNGLNPFQAMCVSAVFFGLAHMNFNQAAYALVLGVILVLLREAAGSLLAPMLFHLVFNGYNVVLMYLGNLLESVGGENTADTIEAITGFTYREYLLQYVSITAVAALFTTALAGCVLAWIAGNEGMKAHMQKIWRERKQNRGKIFRIPFILALVLYVGTMLADVLLL